MTYKIIFNELPSANSKFSNTKNYNMFLKTYQEYFNNKIFSNDFFSKLENDKEIFIEIFSYNSKRDIDNIFNMLYPIFLGTVFKKNSNLIKIVQHKIEELKENKFHYIVYVSDEEINLNKVNKTIEIKNLEEAKMYNMDLENIFKDFELFLNKKITTLNIIRSYCSDSFNQHYGNDLITSFLNFNSIENNKELKGKMFSFFSEKTKEFDFDKEFKKMILNVLATEGIIYSSYGKTGKRNIRKKIYKNFFQGVSLNYFEKDFIQQTIANLLNNL